MKQLLLFPLFLISISFCNAQDTVYVDNAQKITSRENAVAYRVSYSEDNLFRSEVYSLTGKLQSVEYYKDKALTILEGPAKYYNTNGNADSQGSYKNNLREGTWRFYSLTGKQNGFIFFKNGKVATADYLEQFGHMMDDSNDAFPSFKGGKEALIEYIRNTLVPLQKNAKEKISGTVKVGFDVLETGKVTNVHIISGINEKVDQQALKLVNGMPDWHPGVQYDKAVRVPLILPIVF